MLILLDMFRALEPPQVRDRVVEEVIFLLLHPTLLVIPGLVIGVSAGTTSLENGTTLSLELTILGLNTVAKVGLLLLGLLLRTAGKWDGVMRIPGKLNLEK